MRVREGVYGPAFVRWVGDIPYKKEYEHMVPIPDFVHQPASILELIDRVYPPF